MRGRTRTSLPLTLLLAALLAASFCLSVGAATAQSPRHPGAGTPGATLPALSGSHYVYADDGMRNATNSIDEFSATSTGLTYLGTVTTGAFGGGNSGQDVIAMAPTTRIHGRCLVHSDSGNFGNDSAIETFSIDPVTGLLALVSFVPEGNPLMQTNPGEVKVSPTGNDVYLSVTGGPPGSGVQGWLAAFPLKAACVLGPQTTYSLSNNQLYQSLALPDATHLFAADSHNIHDDVYTITGGVHLALASHTQSQVHAPEGAAAGPIAGVTYTFNGTVNSFGALVQANTFDSRTGRLGPVPGSPQGAKNMGTNDETNLYLTPSLGLVTEVEGVNSDVISFQISSGKFSYLNTAPLERTASGPDSQTGLGTYLLVEDRDSGTISACVLAITGVSGCQQVATLTGGGQLGGNGPSGIGAF